MFGSWFAGESARTLDTEYLLETVRSDMQRTTGLLAGLIAESVVTGDARKTEALITQYASGWSDFTYIHVLDEDGFYVTEWQKRPIKFGSGIRKFEQVIGYGGQEFGILSVYVDMRSVHKAIKQHISASRRRSALILLSTTMFIVFFINYFALQQTRENGLKDGK